MFILFASQASTKIKEARKKTSYLVACLFALVFSLLASPVEAHDPKNIDMNSAYEQIFGKNFGHKPHAHRKIVKKANDIDLVAAYKKLFTHTARVKQKPIRKNSSQPLKKAVKKEKQKTVNKNRRKVVTKKVSIHKSTVSNTVFVERSVVPVTKKIKRDANPSQLIAHNKPITTAKKDSPTRKLSKLDALFAKAFGKKATTIAPSRVTVDLRINKSILGDVTVFSNGGGVIDRVEKDKFLALLENIVKEGVFKKVNKLVSNDKKITFGTLAKEGINAEYNAIELSLDLLIKEEFRKPLILSMQSRRAVSVRDENKIKPEDYSGYLNMYSNLVLTPGASKPFLNMKFEGSFSVGNAVFESVLDVRDGTFTSDRTRITYDKPENLQRFMLGNISTGNRNYQENLRLYGLRVSKEFYMNPDLQIRPKANESFVLESDSEVEVLINGRLRQRFHLRAGIYSLEDIGLYDGANNIVVRIKDEFGKITEKTSKQFYESNLLKKGLSVYAFSVGYLSNKQAGATNKLIKNPVLSGYYQKGLTKDLTLGLDAQISANAFLLGSQMITSMPLGIVKSSIAVSGGDEKSSGAAINFEFKPNRLAEKYKLLPENDILKNWTLAGEYRSKDFSLLNSSDTIDVISGDNKKRLKTRLQTNIGLKFNDDWRGNLNVALTDYYDADKNTAINLRATRRYLNSINLSLGAQYDSEDKFSVNMQISIPLSNVSKRNKTGLDFNANSKTDTYASKLTMNPHSDIGKNSLAGSLEYIQNGSSRQQNLDLQYRGNNFETSFKARNNTDSQQINIGFNSSLACVGKRCAVAHPINDSFALVSGPSNQTTPIAINNGNSKFIYSDSNSSGLPDNYTALIAGKNKNAVVKLESYRYQSINIDESTLPNGYDTEKTEFEVFPRYHQGFLIKAGGEPATILSGTLVDENNKPLGFKGGQWVPENKEGKAVAFFSNKAGLFRITSIPAGKYKLVLFDYPNMGPINIAVPDLKGKVHSLGNVQVSE